MNVLNIEEPHERTSRHSEMWRKLWDKILHGLTVAMLLIACLIIFAFILGLIYFLENVRFVIKL